MLEKSEGVTISVDRYGGGELCGVVGSVHDSHEVCRHADSQEAGGGRAARFIAVAEEAVETGCSQFCCRAACGSESKLHSNTPTLVEAFDIRIYISYTHRQDDLPAQPFLVRGIYGLEQAGVCAS
jgi:hypothetical protein